MYLQRCSVDFDSPFFYEVIQKILPQIHYPKKEITIRVLNKERTNKLKKETRDVYKLFIEYPNDDDSIIGIDIYKVRGEDYE